MSKEEKKSPTTGDDIFSEGDACHLDKDYYRLVDHISKLPHRILQNYSLGSLAQMILHEIGHESGFGLKKAVYLIDNPDFDHLVGTAGFCCEECKNHQRNMWECPATFSEDMKDAHFHNDVKRISSQSIAKKTELEKIELMPAIKSDMSDFKDVEELARKIGFENPQVLSWGMKHGNHGILIFEEEENLSPARKNLLKNAVALLSLCGV